MRIADELIAVGYTKTPESFKDLLVDTFANMQPNWTADDLLCHPREALQYCDAVRSRAGVNIDDPIILKALLNIRKNP